MPNLCPKQMLWRKLALQKDSAPLSDLEDGYHPSCIIVRLLTLERANEEIPSKDSWKTQLTKVADLNISATPAVPFTLRRDKMLI